MIATIKRPRIEMRGDIPEKFLEITRKFFGADDVAVIEETDDELIEAKDSDWYKRQVAKRSPAQNLKNFRKIRGLTQAGLAKKVGALPHHISEMESGKRGISKDFALRFSKVLEISVEHFI